MCVRVLVYMVVCVSVSASECKNEREREDDLGGKNSFEMNHNVQGFEE